MTAREESHRTRPPSPSAQRAGATRIVLLAVGGDALCCGIKFVAASQTGSSAVLSEAVHSLVDLCTDLLLLYGVTASRRRPTPDHQLGYGREVFFWNLIVSLLVLAVGAGASILAGSRQVVAPVPLERLSVSAAVLGICFLIESGSLWLGLKTVKGRLFRWELYQSLWAGGNVTVLAVVLYNIAGLFGLAAAMAGAVSGTLLHRPELDGLASIAIGIVLATMALILAAYSRSLLIGVPASAEKIWSIMASAAESDAVGTVNGSLSVHLAPDQLFVALSVAFTPGLQTAAIEDAVEAIERRIRDRHPQVVALFINPQNPVQYVRCAATRYGLQVPASVAPGRQVSSRRSE